MPGLLRSKDELVNVPSCFCSTTASLSKSVCSNGFWSNHANNASCNQLQKFWTELSPQARWELLRVDKQALFEQARKNMYCSRCNGLLLEGFLQIVMYGKSLQQEGAIGQIPCDRRGVPKCLSDGVLNLTTCSEDEPQNQDPSLHPWGGLTTTRDGTLTLLDCYLFSKSLKTLQNVFDSARERERERELLYPDACGGGGRGWISQGMASYGRGHGTRETCALHTARLSCDTLVDFWSALGDETRHSLLKMKEEDFIERLMYRFDSKRFCRDCRRNVIREFKELKELKRMHREPHCTTWFCVADTDFQYEVSSNTVQADWSDIFADTAGTYHHFEWAIGTGEGKSNILEFEDVGMNGSAQVNDLELGSLSACYITVRAWKLDGRYIEHSAKAHALKGHQCVHSRLVVGDGFVAITRGESIRSFFEHAEEVEEDEDDDTMDKDGNDLDGECLRPQKHAKSPELAREFLLDAATVIFKEQVEKAFREGTARQNAHSIFVCLALKMLEERVHVACREIITLEKQAKLLEEEEKEKREEEERRERRRLKEREKKIRRKERLKGKEKDTEPQLTPDPPPNPHSPVVVEDECLTEPQFDSEIQSHSESSPDLKTETTPSKDENDDSSCRRPTYRREFHSDSSSERFRTGGPRFRGENGVNGWGRAMRFNPRKPGFKIQCSCDSHSSTCVHQPPPLPVPARFARKSEVFFDASKQFYRGNQFGYRLKPKINPSSAREFFHTKKVWEPMDSKKKIENLENPPLENLSEAPKESRTSEEPLIVCQKPCKATEEEGGNSCSENSSSSCVSDTNTTISSCNTNMESSVSDSEETSQEKEEKEEKGERETLPQTKSNENSKQESFKKNQNLIFPVLQTAGFYTQIPGSGLIQFPYPNPYLFTDSVSYGPALRPTPVFNAANSRVYPPVCRPSVAKVDGRCGKAAGNVEVKFFGNVKSEENDFSLFHFGGPVGGRKERGGVVEVCNERESGTVEEYDLFATSNGLSFSIF